MRQNGKVPEKDLRTQNIEVSPPGGKQRVISLLSLVRKAGKLVAGADMVKDAARSGQVTAVFAASDLSPKSKKEIEYVCRPLSVPVYPLGVAMDEMAAQIGRRSGILAVTDKGLERKLESLLEQASAAGGTAKALS